MHPSICMGFLGYTIPYANCSQAPRNVYGTGQSKQSVGCFISNFNNRFDTSPTFFATLKNHLSQQKCLITLS